MAPHLVFYLLKALSILCGKIRLELDSAYLLLAQIALIIYSRMRDDVITLFLVTENKQG